MKISLSCPICVEEHIRTKPTVPYTRTQITVPLQNSNTYTFTCDKGHEATTTLQNPKFELLFESGILALKDGYLREAVSSFASSLERFYEKAIEIMTLNRVNANARGYEVVWKSVANHSERQLGALFLLYFQTFGIPIPAFDKNFLTNCGLTVAGKDPVNFRNVVIHQGYVPSYEAALHYGEAVNQYIRMILKSLASKYGHATLGALTISPSANDNGFGSRNVYFIDSGGIVLASFFPPTEIFVDRNRSLAQYILECE